jgi:hypothetical protein
VCFFAFFGAKIWPAAAGTGELARDLRDQTPRYPHRYTEGETLLREYLGPSTATKADSKCCVETITATLSAVY